MEEARMAVKLELYRVFKEGAETGNIGKEFVYFPIGGEPIY